MSAGESQAQRLLRLGGEAVDLLSTRPQRFDAGCPHDAAALEQLAATGRIATIADTIEAQLMELVLTRHPQGLTDPDARRAIATELAGRHPDAYGTWVYYPWDRRLVHVLPEPAFRELRGDRNRYKITTDERRTLGRLRIGIVGLSVGHAIATTLAREGVGHTFVLADHDALSLSNLNRVHAAPHAIGLNKAVLAARSIADVDPYCRVTCLPEGLHPGNLETFFGSGRAALDVVVEECDCIETKARVRHAARERGIPVVMVNSEGGVLDVERFDREPSRPIFHGLAGTVDVEGLATDDKDAKVAFLLPIVGEGNLSDRMVASLVEMDRSVRTWPQLASGVALGAALVTDAVRRLALGSLTRSGRFVVDVEQLVADDSPHCHHAEPVVRTEDPIPPPPPSVDVEHLQSLGRRGPPLTREQAAALVRYATLAPSGGNAQPWAFVHAGNTIECRANPMVPVPAFDPQARSVDLALGAAIENVELAASAMGLRMRLDPPRGDDPTELRARLTLVADELAIDPLLAQVSRRCTNRHLGTGTELADESLAALHREVRSAGARLLVHTSADARARVAELVAEADRLRMLSERMLADLAGELRWTAEDVERGDGLDVRTLGLRPGERATLRLLLRAPAMRLVASIDGGDKIKDTSRRGVRGASAIGLVVGPEGDRLAYVRGGRALQRMWLTATAHAIAVAPMTTLLFLLRLSPQQARALLPPGGCASLERLRAELHTLFPEAAGQLHAFLFTLGDAPTPTLRARRRPADEHAGLLFHR